MAQKTHIGWLIERIIDCCENQMSYYLGHDREELEEDIDEMLEDDFPELMKITQKKDRKKL